MDRRERLEDTTVAVVAALEGHQSIVWTALPGIIESVNYAKATVSVQPSIKAKVLAEDGSSSWVKLPLLVDVPVVLPSGGGFAVTLPIASGDEVLVIFSSRCIDAWWQSGGVQVQSDLRMHDLSDGFAIPGPRSVPNAISNWSQDALEVRSLDGATYVRVKDDEITLKATTVKIQGNLEVTGSSMTHNGTNVGDDHVHGGVDVGIGVTEGPQ